MIRSGCELWIWFYLVIFRTNCSHSVHSPCCFWVCLETRWLTCKSIYYFTHIFLVMQLNSNTSLEAGKNNHQISVIVHTHYMHSYKNYEFALSIKICIPSHLFCEYKLQVDPLSTLLQLLNYLSECVTISWRSHSPCDYMIMQPNG